MNQAGLSANNTHKPMTRVLLSMDGSQGFRQTISWTVFLIGLIIWIAVQGAFSVTPLWTRALPPEVDDSLSYVLKSRQMEECFHQDCPALRDLRKQLSKQYVNDHTRPERRLAGSRIFPVYHPLLSVIILGLKKLGLDWMTAYKVIWTIGPIFFGLAFAYLLAVLWGLPAAGLALGLLAFKVFPDTGLHRVVPSNLAMAMAAIIWARIISQKGKALWALVIGSILMVAMHPIGRVYAVMALFLALSMAGIRRTLRSWFPAILVLFIVGLAFVIFAWVKGVELVNFRLFPKGESHFIGMALGTAETIVEIFANIIRLEPGLFGSIALFCGAVAMGLLTAPWDKRTVAIKTVSIYALFLFAFLFYVSTHPADVIFRMWIPLVVILFGAVGQAIWYAIGQSWALLIKGLKGPGGSRYFRLQENWPIVVLALLLGYSFQMTLRGAEQVYATAKHIRSCQPLLFDSSQPELLLSQARPGDRVLYTSMIIMPYYFIHGAMQLGAVYYHPVMKGTEAANRWLSRPDLRFAVTYNPTVYHPSFEGVKENQWWTTSPEFYFSPLSEPRKHGPISREGMVPASQYRWIEIFLRKTDFPKSMRLMIENPGQPSTIKVIPLEASGDLHTEDGVNAPIPSRWSGWITLDLSKIPLSRRLRIVLPKGQSRFLIGGIVFGNDQHHWPWSQKADLTFLPKDGHTGPISLSFDPSKILPAPLNRKKISVLDDRGSSVLFKIHQ